MHCWWLNPPSWTASHVPFLSPKGRRGSERDARSEKHMNHVCVPVLWVRWDDVRTAAWGRGGGVSTPARWVGYMGGSVLDGDVGGE